jgi:predicted phosphoribosyltransferase
MQNSSTKRFGNRREAGRELARRLSRFAGSMDAVVLALPKGGVAVGAEIARTLGLPFDVLLVGRITAPGCGDTALGAITSGGVRLLNNAMIDRLGLNETDVRNAVLKECRHLARREKIYRGQRPSLEIADQTVILVDDGTASCSTVRNAIRLLRRQHAERVVVAMPAACHHTACDMRMEADEVLTLAEPSSPVTVGQWFDSFPRTKAADVRRLLSGEFSETAAGHRN